MSGAELAVLSVVTGVMGAQAQVRAAQAQANQLRAEAKQTELQGRVQALNAKREGVSALKNLERVLAANTARQAASNINFIPIDICTLNSPHQNRSCNIGDCSRFWLQK